MYIVLEVPLAKETPGLASVNGCIDNRITLLSMMRYNESVWYFLRGCHGDMNTNIQEYNIKVCFVSYDQGATISNTV